MASFFPSMMFYLDQRNNNMALYIQLIWLFVLAIPAACVAWTVTHEEIFREPHEFCLRKSKACKTLFWRKFFFLFTCEYCFSHYVVILIIILTNFQLLFDDWRGYIIGGFAMVWIANVYMSLFALLRQSIKKEKVEIEVMEKNVKEE